MDDAAAADSARAVVKRRLPETRRTCRQLLARPRRTAAKRPDKNGQFRGAVKGEKRVGVGRPTQRVRSSERHQVRPTLLANQPVHVVLRADSALGSLRTKAIYYAIRAATLVASRREDSFRIVHLSVQRTHVHLIVEAKHRMALARGMQGFAISAAKHINALFVGEGGERRRGGVFVDRYHARSLTTPREVRHCLAYVLNNWRHHDERDRAVVDPYSTAYAFDGWKQPVDPPALEPLHVWKPRVWLLTTGWRKHRLIDPFEVPGTSAAR